MSTVTDHWLANILMSPPPRPTAFNVPAGTSQSRVAEPNPYLLPEQEQPAYVHRIAEALVRRQSQQESSQPIDEALAAQQARDVAMLRLQRAVRPPGGRPDGPLMEFANQIMFPQSPSDAALYLLGGPFGRGVKAVGLGLGLAMDSSPAQAGVDKVIRAGGRLVDRLRGKFPQFAEHYPDHGPHIQKVDRTTGRTYSSKHLTPEAEELARVRTILAQDMRQNGFVPFFDPNWRSHVDPSYYPRTANTLDIVPAQQTTLERWARLIDNDATRSRLSQAYERGKAMPDAHSWSAMQQLEDAFIAELGRSQGRQAFQNQFAAGMAATTAGTSPAQNFRLAHYGNYLRANRLAYPTAAHEMPVSVGGQFAMPNIGMHARIADAGGISALGLQNPKRHDYGFSFLGHPDVVPIDSRITSAMTPGWAAPSRGTYGLYGRVIHDEAKRLHLLPRDYGDLVWAGLGPHASRPAISEINDIVELTHRLNGLPRDEVVRRGLILGQIPLFGLGGLATLPHLDKERARTY